MRALLLCLAIAGMAITEGAASQPPRGGMASWYGETHRGRLMANGKRFNPDKLTAASWFYPLGTTVQVTRTTGPGVKARSVLVTITDRGPDRDLARDGRIIDLTHAAFKRLAEPDLGLVRITVRVVRAVPADLRS